MANHYHLLELVRYVVLNPMRAKLVCHPRRWNSYNATAGDAPALDLLAVNWILTRLGNDPNRLQLVYRQFVAEGRRLTIWENLHGGCGACKRRVSQEAEAGAQGKSEREGDFESRAVRSTANPCIAFQRYRRGQRETGYKDPCGFQTIPDLP